MMFLGIVGATGALYWTQSITHGMLVVAVLPSTEQELHIEPQIFTDAKTLSISIVIFV